MNEDRIKSIVEDIISKDEFQPEKAADLSWLDNIRNFIGRIISVVWEFISKLIYSIIKKIFNLFNIDTTSISKFGGLGNIIITIIGLIIAAGLTVLLVLIIIKIIKRYDKEKVTIESISEELVSFIDEPNKPYEMAMMYFNEEKYRLAFRYLFLSLFVIFNQKDLIKIHIAKTNRQYLYELKYNNTEFFILAEGYFKAFDLIWYGGRPLSREDYLLWDEKYKLIIDKLSLIKKEAKDE